MIAVLSSAVISLAPALLCLAIPRWFRRVSIWQVAVLFTGGLIVRPLERNLNPTP